MSKVPLKMGRSVTPSPRSVGGKTPQTRATTAALASSNATEQPDAPQTSTTVAKPAPLKVIAEMLTSIIRDGKPGTHIKQEILKVITFAKESEAIVEGEGKEGEARTNVSDAHLALREDIRAALRKDLVKLHDSLEIQIVKVQQICDTKAVKSDLGKFYEGLNGQLNGISSTLNVTLESSEKARKASEGLINDSSAILSKIGNVTSAADKIADATQSYRDVLVTRQTPVYRTSVDPKVLGDMERKAKQILVDIFDEEGTNTLEKSLTELISKANEAFDKMNEAAKPALVKVETAHKTKKNAILFTLNSKEAANWVREPGNEETFADAFSKGSHIRDRLYNIVAPRVPLTFEPGNTTHLREIEEANGLTQNVLRKARWIKPVERRRSGQTHAYAILSFSSADTANKLIRDGLGICGSLIRPAKQKQEPVQCMKCRRWGHFADKCLETGDTCGTCGESHRTSTCANRGKLYCVSCGDNTHASWDRSCPDFIRRCENLDDRNPMNGMPFYPAEQDWTLSSRPSRVPLEERFPMAYAVNSLPTSNMRKAQRRKGQSRGGNPPQQYPNNIQIPERNRYDTREAGELPDDKDGIPQWMREPIGSSLITENTDGDVTQQNPLWI